MHTLAMHQTVSLSEQETHQAPDVLFTSEQAHAVMRYHVTCRAIRYPRKAAVLEALSGV
jgi:hypothetical protein